MRARPRTVLFIQGGGEGTHDDWDDRLVASLEKSLGSGHEVSYPRMPDEGDPSFDAWSARIRREIERLEDGVIVVGHSIGGTVLIHTLAKAPELLGRVAAIYLIAAPYVGEGGWPADEIAHARNWGEALAETVVYLYQGDHDDTTPMAHLELYETAIPRAVGRRLAGRDHQLNDDLSEVAEDIARLT